MAKLKRTHAELKTGALHTDNTSGLDGVRPLSEFSTLPQIRIVHDS
jgi:hypothetical protein